LDKAIHKINIVDGWCEAGQQVESNVVGDYRGRQRIRNQKPFIYK
jgi:hypothetical protein